MSAPEAGRHQPTALRTLGRAALVGLAAVLIVAPVYWWLGPPTAARLYGRDEFARFAPSVGHGLGQLIGETALSLLVIWMGRRWLRVRL